jgi:peptidoglycan/LPS O-acetylase OafA/YrhL
METTNPLVKMNKAGTIADSASFEGRGLEDTLRPPSSTPHLEYIDALRGVACLAVMMHHSFILTPPPLAPHGWLRVLYSFADMGWLGVHLFLVLSGFCLFYPLAKKSPVASIRLDIADFARRRARRILPPYYAALLLFVGLAIAGQILHNAPIFSAFAGIKDIVLHVVLLQNLLPSTLGSIDPPMWSLALECQLYVCFPLFVYVAAKFGPGWLLLASFCLSVFWQAGCYCELGSHPEWHVFATCFYALPGRCFEFVSGMIAAVLVAKPVSGQRRLAFGIIIGMIIPAVYLSRQQIQYFPTRDQMWGGIFAAIVVLLSTPVLANLFRKRNLLGVFTGLGIFSYSTYLIHEPIMTLLTPERFGFKTTTEFRVLVFTLLRILLVLLIAFAFFWLIERPFISKKRKATTIRIGDS